MLGNLIRIWIKVAIRNNEGIRIKVGIRIMSNIDTWVNIWINIVSGLY